jgi:hypothetical protein
MKSPGYFNGAGYNPAFRKSIHITKIPLDGVLLSRTAHSSPRESHCVRFAMVALIINKDESVNEAIDLLKRTKLIDRFFHIGFTFARRL